jgi:hypothetical protein
MIYIIHHIFITNIKQTKTIRFYENMIENMKIESIAQNSHFDELTIKQIKKFDVLKSTSQTAESNLKDLDENNIEFY